MHMRIVAECLAKSINLKTLDFTRLSHSAAMRDMGNGNFVMAYKYGALVYFGVQDEAIEGIRAEIAPHSDMLDGVSDTEHAEIVAGEMPISVYNGKIRVKTPTQDQLFIIADVLSKSVVLSRYENMILEMLATIEPIADNMRRGKILGGRKKLIKTLGDSLAIQAAMVSRIMVDEKPEQLWDMPELEKLFALMNAEYEINERQRVLEGRLRVITDTVRYNTDILDYLSSYRVEWYITLLIVVEILLTLYEMFFKHA
jgi:uncharacterized Rmd1/YagE family protein